MSFNPNYLIDKDFEHKARTECRECFLIYREEQWKENEIKCHASTIP